MEKFKGTPGPWFVDGRSVWNSKPGEYRDGDVYVAEAFTDDDVKRMSDANLIAAAPDLLDALQDIVSSSQAFHSALEIDHEFDGVALYDNAVKAIARALGKNEGDK